MRYFVLGANKPEALTWVESRGLHPHSDEVRVIGTVAGLEGLHIRPDDELILTGNWWRRPDLREIIRTIARSLAKTKGRNHQVERVVQPLIDDWAEQDRRRVTDEETMRLHQLHLRRGGTR